MNLAVAGLKPNEVTRRMELLATGNWAGFSAAHQAAFLFARKQAFNPGSLTGADLVDLEKHWGKDKMWQPIFWSARCHYMTRVADAFQLPLEKDNVFLDKPVQIPMKTK